MGPPPPRIVVQADLPIRTLITDMDSRTIAHFDRLATNRTWLYTLNAAAYHTGQVPSDSGEVNRPFPDADSPANLTNNRRLIFSLQRWPTVATPTPPNKVMKADASVAAAIATVAFGASAADVWVTFALGLSQATIDLFTAPGSGDQVQLLGVQQGGLDLEYLFLLDPTLAGELWVSASAGAGSIPAPVEGWQTCEFHYQDGTLSEFFIDGTQVWSVVETVTGLADGLLLGATNFFPNDPASVVYFNDVKVGTTRGGTDIFFDDFEGGTLDAWTTEGDVSVIDDPFPTPPVTLSHPYQPIFGGIVTIPEDQGTDAPTTRYTAHDPWQLMMSRPVRDPDTGDLAGPNGITFASGSRASDIALSFLAQTEAFDGESHIDSSDSGLIEATDPLPSSITFGQGLSVGEAWTQLVETGTIDIHLLPMYEPITAPGKVVRFQTVRQADGVAAGPIRYGATMGWDLAGNSLAEINRLVDGTRMANTIAYYDANGNPVPIQTDADSVTANGVYFAQQFFPGANDITLIALLAVAQLAIRRKGQRSIALSPAPERSVMPLRDYNLGDYVPVWASRNLREPLGIDYASFDPDYPGASGYQRIYAIPLAADDNGVATVTGLLTSKEN